MKAKLFVLRRVETDEQGYAYVEKMVVLAENETRARELAVENAGRELPDVWEDYSKTHCEQIVPSRVYHEEVLAKEYH